MGHNENFQQFVNKLNAVGKNVTGTLQSEWGGIVQLGVRRWAAAVTSSAENAANDHEQLKEALRSIESVYRILQKSELSTSASPNALESDHLRFLLTSGKTVPAAKETQRITESLLRSVAAARLVAGLNAPNAIESISEWLPALLDPMKRLRHVPTFTAEEAGTAWSKQDICRWLLEQSTSSKASSDDFRAAAAVARCLIERLPDNQQVDGSACRMPTSLLEPDNSSPESADNQMKAVTIPVLFDYVPLKNHVDPQDFIGYLTLTTSSGAGRLLPDPDMLVAFEETWLTGFEEVWTPPCQKYFPDKDVFWKLETRRFVEVVAGRSAQAAFHCAIRCLAEGRPWPKGLIVTGALAGDQLQKVGGVANGDFTEGGKLWAVGDKNIAFQTLAVPKISYDVLAPVAINQWVTRTGKEIKPCGTLKELFLLADDLAKQESKQLRILVSLPECLRDSNYEKAISSFFREQQRRFEKLLEIRHEFSSHDPAHVLPMNIDLVIGIVADSLGARRAVPSSFYEHPDNYKPCKGQENSREVRSVPERSKLEMDLLSAIKFSNRAQVVLLEHWIPCDLRELRSADQRRGRNDSHIAISQFMSELASCRIANVHTERLKGDLLYFLGLLPTVLKPRLTAALEAKGLSPDEITKARPPATWKGCPFRGLQRFEFEHAAIFRGRQKQVSKLCTKFSDLAQNGEPTLILVHGSSGAGKSSLLRAGLLPAMINNGAYFEEGAECDVRAAIISLDEIGGSMESGTAWTARVAVHIATALLRDEEHSGDAQIFPKALPALDKSPTAFAKLIEEHPAEAAAKVKNCVSEIQLRSGKRSRLVVCLDQLDKLLLPEHRAESAAFLKFFVHLAELPQIWIAASLQASSLDKLSETILEKIYHEGHLFPLQPPSIEDWVEIVVGVADLAAVTFEERADQARSLSAQILADATGESDCLPLVEFALWVLYEEAKKLCLPDEPIMLRYTTYESFGGLGGVLKRKALELKQVLSQSAVESGCGLFWHLVRFDLQSQMPSVRMVDLDESSISHDLNQFLTLAAEKRFITVHRSSDTYSRTIRLAHQRLVQEWELLSSWVSENSKLLPMRENIELQCANWKAEPESQQDARLLASGGPLEDGLKLINSSCPLAPQTRSFIERSQTKHIRIQRRNTWLFRGAMVALVLFAGLSIALYWKSEEATDAQQTAEQNEKTASDNLRRFVAAENSAIRRALEAAEANIQRSLTNLDTINRQGPSVSGLSLVRQTQSFAEKSRSELESRIATLAGQSELFDQSAIRTLLNQSALLNPLTLEDHAVRLLRQFPEPQWTRELNASVETAAVSPDCRLLAIVLRDSTSFELLVLDLESELPTDCRKRLGLGGEKPKICWSSGSDQLFLLSNELVNNTFSDVTQIVSLDARSGKHQNSCNLKGIVHTAGCSSDGTVLFVLNKIDNSLAAYHRALQDAAVARQDKSSSSAQQSIATYRALSTTDFSELASHTFNAPVIDATHGDRTIALISPKSETAEYSVSIAMYDEKIRVQEISTPGEVQTPVRVSQDGQYLVIKEDFRGFSLFALSPELRKVADIGSATGYSDAVVTTLPESVSIVGVEFEKKAGVAPGRGVVSGRTITEYEVQFRMDDSSMPGPPRVESMLSVDVKDTVTSIDVNTRIDLLAVGTASGHVQIFQSLYDRNQSPILDVPSGCVLARFLEKYKLLTISTDGQIRVWDISRNSLGEPVRLEDISSLASHRYIRSPATVSSMKIAPNGECGICVARTTEDGFAVQLCKPLFSDVEEIRLLETSSSSGQVLFSNDSRFGAVICGSIAPKFGVSPILASALLQLSDDSGVASLIPDRSNVSLYDSVKDSYSTNLFTERGPIVGTSFRETSGSELLVASLDLQANRGRITTLNLESHAWGARQALLCG